MQTRRGDIAQGDVVTADLQACQSTAQAHVSVSFKRHITTACHNLKRLAAIDGATDRHVATNRCVRLRCASHVASQLDGIGERNGVGKLDFTTKRFDICAQAHSTHSTGARLDKCTINQEVRATADRERASVVNQDRTVACGCHSATEGKAGALQVNAVDVRGRTTNLAAGVNRATERGQA